MQGKKHYNEKLFTSFHLSNRIPEDNFYRRLKSELDLQFLYKATKSYYGKEGQESIDPVVFFKLILIGYLENLNSDRKIINHVSMRLDLLYFIGYDIDEELPWHSTVSRTRQLYGEEVFRKLFKEVLRLCVNQGMVKGKRQAIDSAYIKANASMDSLLEKEVIEDGDIYISEFGEDTQVVTSQKKEEVERHHQWKEKEYKDQPRGRKNQRPDEDMPPIRGKFLSNHTHYSSTDPEARISTKPGKPRQLTFTGQASVDTASHVITNIMADYSDKRDSQSLPKAMEQTITNLAEHDLKVEEVLADTGYSSGESLQYLKDNNITGYIPNFGQYKASREGFTYHKEGDYYECSRGVKIPFKKIKDTHGGQYQVKSYRSSWKDCKTCPINKTCIGNANYKKIEDTVDKHLYDEMHERLKTAKAKRMKKLRSSTVEPVLGTLINFRGMRRIWTRGLASANKFMIGAAIAYNLMKWMNYKNPKRNSKIMAMKEGGMLSSIYNKTSILLRSRIQLKKIRWKLGLESSHSL